MLQMHRFKKYKSYFLVRNDTLSAQNVALQKMLEIIKNYDFIRNKMYHFL